MGKKVKYVFNHKTLSFEHARLTARHYILKVLSYLSTSVAFTAVIVLIGTYFFDSPKERMLKREIRQYELQFKLINERMAKLETVLNDMADRDDNIYRVIFESEPIPTEARKAGIGGSDRYRDLEGYRNSEILVKTARKLDQITAKMYIQSKSFDEVYEMAINKSRLLAGIPAIQPVSNQDLRRLSSYFGWRTDPFYKVQKFHEGVDFSAPPGTEIYATGDGKVLQADRSKTGYGNQIVIDHGFGYKTMYAHLQSFKVRAGETVKRGQVIGTLGSTGKSTSPHLHYEVWKNNTPVNPINYFFNDITPEQYEEMLILSQRPSQTMD
ncbi:MAG TPA: M23 family metallopeptidase [Bacteroidales bacterium]|nr:M23 family metallopeptidase [Bacteroidales bacterium]HPI85748.1 M23 family metallopeptidase [Bacteroidales bacterium]